MNDDNFDLSSLPSSMSFSSSYTPKSAEESPLDSPFAFSPLQEKELSSPKDSDQYTWVPIDDQWKKFLMSESYLVKDCPSEGNCQFHSLEEAIKSDPQIKTSHKKLRVMVAEHILQLSDLEFQDILNNYKAEKESGEFHGEWDPYTIKTKRQLALQLKKSGTNFEGDNMTLAILSKILHLDIFIFNQKTHTITKIENENPNFIIINFIQRGNTGHYQTIGFKVKKRVQTFFNRENLSNDMLSLVDTQLFYNKHIRQIYDLYDPFTCNDLISNIELTVGKLSGTDKKLVCKLAAQLVSEKKSKPNKSKKSKSVKTKSKSTKCKSKKTKSKSVKRKSKKTKSKSVKRKSKKTKSKSVKRKSKKTKSKSVKRKSKKTKSKSVKRKSKKTKSKSVKRKSKSVKRKSKSVKRKSKKTKSKSVKRKSKKTKSKSVKRKSKKTKSKSVKRKSKKTKSKSVKRKSKKTKSKSVKRKSKSVKRKSKKTKSKSVKRKSKKTK